MKPEWIAAAGVVSAVVMAASVVTFIVADMLRDWAERITNGTHDGEQAQEGVR